MKEIEEKIERYQNISHIEIKNQENQRAEDNVSETNKFNIENREKEKWNTSNNLEVSIFSKNNEPQEKFQQIVLEVESSDKCIHEVLKPVSFIRESFRPPEIPYKEYPFKLDPFQIEAIKCIERNECLLVSAHTSAGKTVIAEYAIASSLTHQKKVIYTSPIKALSNQKYRELLTSFQNVGLITGDVTINPSANCLVMTTEILRSILYKLSEIVNEIAWVIFDEIHYMHDKERGVIWEEAIILLPPSVNLVFLSATIENSREFAEWIAKIKNKPCNVIYTDHRPVPLVHYIYPLYSNDLIEVKNKNKEFNEDNFNLAFSKIAEDKKFGFKSNETKKESIQLNIVKLLSIIKEKGFLPCLFFSFNKKQCEYYALSLANVDLTTYSEKQKIKLIFKNAISILSEEDQNLGMIYEILHFLERGIGIHHGGLLPIIKEVTEILFQEQFIKVLFTTETFAMGINMPAKSVVFTSINKFDGNDHRKLESSEYIQMSGRAGRRGKDDIGITILIAEKKSEYDDVKEILLGKSKPLNSSFYLKYDMILNYHQYKYINPLQIIKMSFFQHQIGKKIPLLLEEINSLELDKSRINFQNKKEIKRQYRVNDKINKLERKIGLIISQPDNLLGYLSPGRIVQVKSKTNDWGWGIVVNFVKKKLNLSSLESNKFINEGFIVDIMLYLEINTNKKITPGSVIKRDGKLGIIPVFIENIMKVSSIQLNIEKDLQSLDKLEKINDTFLEIMEKFNFHPPEIDPIAEMKIKDEKLQNYIKKKEMLIEETKNNLNISEEEKALYENYLEIKSKILKKDKLINNYNLYTLKDEMIKMEKVLRRLEYFDNVKMLDKGKIASEITTANQIIITELMNNGTFDTLPSEIIIAILSCIASTDSKSTSKECKNQILKNAYDIVFKMATNIGQIMQECKICISPEEFAAHFNYEIMEIVYEWANGKQFYEICKINPEIHEGIIVRLLRRLDELITEITSGLKKVGNKNLLEKFEEGSKKIKRGIVSASSLYF